MTRKLPPALWPSLFWLAIVLTGWFGLVPSSGVGEPTFGWDKTDHLLAFGAMAVCWRLAWPRTPWAMVFAGLMGYGLLIETLQAFIPGRQASVIDMLADAIGTLGGLILVRALQSLRLRSA